MIKYTVGDATNPKARGKKIIVHICNDIGGWGAGFVLAISKKWPQPEETYRLLAKHYQLTLGDVHFIEVEKDITIINMVAQHGTISRPSDDKPPIRYDALEICLGKVNDYAIENSATIHMPRIGCGLAGGKWEEVEKIINKVISVPVTVYDF